MTFFVEMLKFQFLNISSLKTAQNYPLWEEKRKRMAYFLNDTYNNIVKILVYLQQLIIQFEAKIKPQTFSKNFTQENNYI